MNKKLQIRSILIWATLLIIAVTIALMYLSNRSATQDNLSFQNPNDALDGFITNPVADVNPVVLEATTQNNPFDVTIIISPNSVAPKELSAPSQTIIRWLNTSPEAQNLEFLEETVQIPTGGEYFSSLSGVDPGQYTFQITPLKFAGEVVVTP